MENNDIEVLSKYLNDINSSIEDMRKNPVKVPDRVPGNLEILLSGVSKNDSGIISYIFSSGLDKKIEQMLDAICNGRLEEVQPVLDGIRLASDAIFGDKSFRGEISTTVLNTIQNSMNSTRFIQAKSIFGKVGVLSKRLSLILRNLEAEKSRFKDNKEKLKKYKETIYALKSVLKFASRVYRNRALINDKVVRGLKNVIYENEETLVLERLVD